MLPGVSLEFTIFANWLFGPLSDQARAAWRQKLYDFKSEADWTALVERPLRRGKRVYWWPLPFVGAFYLVAILYLLAVAEPGLVDTAAETYGRLVARLAGWRS